MNFVEAYAALKDGHYVTRDAWDASGEYCIFLPGMPYIWKILLIPNPSAGNWLPMVADLDATDWKVYPKESVNLNAEVVSEEATSVADNV